MLAFIVIILLIVGAISIFLFTNKKSTPPQSQIVPTPVAAAVSPTQIPSPSPEITQSPEQALQQVTIDNPNADIQNISADAQQL